MRLRHPPSSEYAHWSSSLDVPGRSVVNRLSDGGLFLTPSLLDQTKKVPLNEFTSLSRTRSMVRGKAYLSDVKKGEKASFEKNVPTTGVVEERAARPLFQYLLDPFLSRINSQTV